MPVYSINLRAKIDNDFKSIGKAIATDTITLNITGLTRGNTYQYLVKTSIDDTDEDAIAGDYGTLTSDYLTVDLALPSASYAVGTTYYFALRQFDDEASSEVIQVSFTIAQNAVLGEGFAVINMPNDGFSNYINDLSELTNYNADTDMLMTRRADGSLRKIKLSSVASSRTNTERTRTIGYSNCYYTITNNPATNAVVFNQAINELYALGGGLLVGDNKLFEVSDTIVPRSDATNSVSFKNINCKLANGANKDLFKTYNYDTLLNSNLTNAGYAHFSWINVILDGNRTNNINSSTFKRYGYAGYFENVTIINGAEYNVSSEWAVGAEATATNQIHNGMEDIWVAPRIYNAGHTNVDWRGPHDSILVAPLIFNDGTNDTTTLHNLYVRASSTYASGPLFIVGGHIWGKTQDDSVVTETSDANNSAKLVGLCDIEGALTTGKYALNIKTGGNYLFAHVYFSANGIKVNGNHNTLDIKVSNIEEKCIDLNSVSSSVLRFHVEAGNATTTLAYNDANATGNILDLQAFQGQGSDYFGGTINNINNGNANRIVCVGLANPVHIHTWGQAMRLRNGSLTIEGNAGEQMKVYSTAKGGDIMNINATNDPAFQFPNQTKLEGFNGNYSDMTWRISTWNGKADFRQLNLSNLPTSASGLSAGDIWRDNGDHLRIV